MTSSDTRDAPPGSELRPRRRPIKLLFIILSLIVLGIATLLSIWTARRYQQAVELAKRTRERYTALDTAYSFTPPSPGQRPPARRWQAMLRVRGEIQRQAQPDLRRRLEALLRVDSLHDPTLYRELLAGIPQLAELLDAQIEALRREQMSAREYQWMLGLGIVKVMESSAQIPTSEGTWRALEQLERLTHADADRGNNVEARAVFDFLREKYREADGPDPDVIATLRQRDEAACAIDLAMAMIHWTAPEEKAPEGLLRKVLPRN